MKKIITLIKVINIKYVKRQVACMMLLIINMGLSIVYPGCISFVIDYGIEKGNVQEIILYTVLILIIGFLIILSNYFYQIQCGKFGREVCEALRKEIFSKLCRANYHFWSVNKVGNIVTVLDSDVSSVEKLITTTLSNGVLNAFTFAGITMILTTYNMKIGILICLLAVYFASLQRKNGVKVSDGRAGLRNKVGELNAYSQEVLNNMPDIGLVYSEELLSKEYIRKHREVNKEYLEQIKHMLRGKNIGLAFNTLAIFLSLLMGAYSIVNNEITMGVLVSIIIYVQQLYSPVINLGETYSAIKNAQPIIDRIIGLLINNEEVDSGTYIPEQSLQGNIEFKNVTFFYNENERKIIDNLDISIEAGKIYGIIGNNGMGKSTFVRLIAGLCSPKNGVIYIDGVAVEKYNIGYLRQHIGYLLQKPYLLSDVFKKNQLENCDITKSIMLSEDLEIKENGKGVSGGENQKLALLHLLSEEQKDIYILDEPTAAMDQKSEERICQIIKEKLQGRTVLIITHRSAILDICDEVIDFNRMTNLTKV